MLSAQGIAEIARTGLPAVVGGRVFTVEHIIRATRRGDWVDWIELTPRAARRLADELTGDLILVPSIALPAAPTPTVLEGTVVSASA